MKKMKYIFILSSFIVLMLCIYFIDSTFSFRVADTKDKSIVDKIQKKYQNQDIVGVLQIDNLLTEPITKNYNEKNTLVKLFSNNFNTNYLRVYGDNLLELNNYLVDFYIYKNPYLTIYFDNEIYKYLIFSVGIVSKDEYDGLEVNDTINFLQKNMIYNLNLNINANDKIMSLIVNYSENKDSYLLINGIRFF